MPTPELCRARDEVHWRAGPFSTGIRHKETSGLATRAIRLQLRSVESHRRGQAMNGHTQTAIEGVAVTAAQLFGDHLDHFRQHLLDQHHGDGTVRQYMRCISVLAELMKLEKI